MFCRPGAHADFDTVVRSLTEGRQTIIIHNTEVRAEVVNLDLAHLEQISAIIAQVRISNDRDVTFRGQGSGARASRTPEWRGRR